MHSLFLRIFLLFLLAMTLIVGSSIATTFTIASRTPGGTEIGTSICPSASTLVGPNVSSPTSTTTSLPRFAPMGSFVEP